MGVTSAVGARFAIWGREGKIVDVMINFNYQSLRNTIEPLAFFGDPSESRFGLVRLRAGDIPAALAAVQGIWERVLPRYPFDYQFLDEDFDGMYRSEERMSTLLGYFAVFAVVIACLGLFGLASFTAEQRTKEIGVRKVLGASAPQVVVLLCKEFSVLVVLASVLACPAAYLIMSDWLQTFAYKTDIGMLPLLTAAATALIVALITVSYHAIRAAMANPVKSLQYE